LRAPREDRVGSEEEVFAGHMAFLNGQRTLGHSPISGPFGDDGPLRGISIYDTTSVDDVRVWVANDPAVRNGWFTVDVRPWWGVAGSALPF
jgi:uncharacterized protein YciI